MQPDTSNAVQELRQKLLGRSCGIVHAQVFLLEYGDAIDSGSVMSAAGLTPVATDSISSSTAREYLVRGLTKDMAYGSSLVAEDEALRLVNSWLDLFGKTACYWTNGSLLAADNSPGWNSATAATFDSGVCVVGQKRAGVLWFEDED